MRFSRLAAGVSVAAVATLAVASPVSATTPPAPSYSFTMANSLADVAGTTTLTPAPQCASPDLEDVCNDSTSFGTDADGNFWSWVTTQGNGGGITFSSSVPLQSTYTFAMKFAITTVSNDENLGDRYTKIVDFKGLTDDNGLYLYGDDPLTVSNGFATGEATYAVDDVIEMTAVRGSDNMLTVYVKTPAGFETAYTYDDSNGDFTAVDAGTGSLLSLFQDENETVSQSHEAPLAGRLYGFQMWPGVALSLDEVQGIEWAAATPAAPETPAATPELASTGVNANTVGSAAGLAVLLAGAGVVAIAVRRRRSAR